ncbi:MAG TPA: hypothetical protein VNG71_02860 [Pyrinomonadaceae bacterium]|nr:hypothetical protein [Pyrinomonadaceae bacterium]
MNSPRFQIAVDYQVAKVGKAFEDAALKVQALFEVSVYQSQVFVKEAIIKSHVIRDLFVGEIEFSEHSGMRNPNSVRANSSSGRIAR